MKKFIITAIIIIIGYAGYAQKKSKTKTYIVTIEKYEVLDSLDFNIGNLIDKRPFKDNIGVAQVGAFNKKAIALLPDSLHTYLQPILKKMVPDKPRQKAFDVIVYDLMILEHTGAMKETGYCKLQIELVRDSLSYGFYDTYIKTNGMDVTGGHGKRIIKAFATCLKEFNRDGLHQPGEKLLQIDTPDFQFPSTLEKGTYTSLNNIVRRKPDTEDDFTIKKHQSKKLDKYWLLDKENSISKKRNLLYSDGKELYVHASNYSFDHHYVKVKHKGRYLYFEDRLTDPATATAMAAAFGVAGLLLSNKKQGIILDTTTGIVSVLSPKKIKELLIDNTDLYKKYQQSRKDLVVKELVILELNKLAL